jgi:predicted phage terminase large subunit-like protein
LQWGRGWDMASTKEAGDYTSGPRALYHKDTGDIYLESMKRGQWSAATAEFEFTKAVEEDLDLDPDFKIGMEQEPGSSGKYSVRHYEKLARETVKGVSVKEFPAVTSKLLRATTFLAALEHGHVYVVVDDEADLYCEDKNDLRTLWVRTLFEEMELFPEGAHDDQVDGTVVLYQLLSGKIGLKASIGRRLGANGRSVDLLDGLNGRTPSGLKRKGATFGRRQGLISGLGRPSGISGVRRIGARIGGR